VRKKSHISLAKYLVENVDTQELNNHRKAFYLGNVLPDCKPSFLTERHEFNDTYEQFKMGIKKLTIECDLFSRNERVYWRKLGESLHYLADYFTFPHNITFEGSLKEHCSYEKELKLYFREYVMSGEADSNHMFVQRFDSLDKLFHFIEVKHVEYLRMKGNIHNDTMYIITLCTQVVYGIIHLLNQRLSKVLQPVLI